MIEHIAEDEVGCTVPGNFDLSLSPDGQCVSYGLAKVDARVHWQQCTTADESFFSSIH
jgi:hypothetical protein